MKQHFYRWLVSIWLLIGAIVFVNGGPLSLEDLMVKAEHYPEIAEQGRQSALAQNLPVHIFLPGRAVIEVLGTENGRPLYGVIINFAHPFQNGSVARFEEIETKFDLSSARIRYGDGRVIHPHIGQPSLPPRQGRATPDSLLLILDSSNDRVMAFDYATGDIVDLDFLPNAGQFQTPIQARKSPRGTITVSDQLTDLVLEYDTSGVYLGPYAPAGGVNNAILDNIRGHFYRSNGNLLVCVASGANSDAIAQFDTAGNFLGNFIANNSGGLDSPWDILWRGNDVLVSASMSDALHRYDTSGTYLSDFAAVNSFPRQMVEFPNGDIGVANFSPSANSGILLYDAGGNFISLLNVVDGNRGLWILGNGNLITTNGTGVYEVDPGNNTLVRVIASGFSAQHIGLYVRDTAGALPAAIISPTNINFGNVPIDSSTTDTVTVKNIGSALLTLSTVIESFGSSFSVSPDTAAISPADSQVFVVTFGPVTVGEQFANLIFNHNAPGAADTVALSGTGAAAIFSANPSSLNFGSISQGGSTTDSVIAANTGNLELIIDPVYSTHSRFSVDPLQATVPAGESVVFFVTFDADTLPGFYQGEIIFTHNGPGSPDTVEVQGDVITAIGDGDAGELPKEFALHQNYPNPFNPATIIRYDLPAAETVSLKVYDLNGRLAAVLVHERQEAGIHEFHFRGADLASGIYFYTLTAGDFSQTRQMLLLK